MSVASSALEQFFVPFARVDAVARTVEGYAFTTPTVAGDKWNLKRASLERAAPRYMQMPCVRSMHQPLAAGKATQVSFDEKGAFIKAYIGDEAEWKKCLEGIYRGFSIGGKPLITRGNDIEEFDWIETSLVDRPKDPGALFTVVRVEDELAGAPTRELAADVSDESLDLVRAEMGLGTGLERGMVAGDVPVRENGTVGPLVAGAMVAVDGRVNALDEALARLREKMRGASDGAVVERAFEAALRVLEGRDGGAGDEREVLSPENRMGDGHRGTVGEAQRGEMAFDGELFRVRSELERSAGEAETLLQRAETAEGQVLRLEGDLSRLDESNALLRAEVRERDEQIAVLRSTPLVRRPPVLFPAALGRGFAVNDLMDGAGNEGRAELMRRRDAAREAAQKEGDVTRRGELVTEWMRLDGELAGG